MDGELEHRDRLSSLQGLLVLSMLMTESDDQERIAELAATSVGSLGPFRLHGVRLRDGGWRWLGDPLEDPEVRFDVEARFAGVGVAGGAVSVPGAPWSWAFPLRGLDTLYGHLVVGADEEPGASGVFLLGVLAQQAGIALANAGARLRQRRAAEDLRAANETLAETVAVLEHRTAVHERLTRAAAEGGGEQGIVTAITELTGLAAAIEDRAGNLRAWSGRGPPDAYRAGPASGRDAVIRRAAGRAAPVRDGPRLVAVAGPREDVLGVLVLIDPDGRAGERERLALEHGATVLSVELLRQRELAEVELRIGRALIDELLAGADDDGARRHARAMGYDVERPHRVVVVENPRPGPEEGLVHAVRRAARILGAGTLVMARGREVVLLADAEVHWDRLHAVVLGESERRRCRIGVGGSCADVAGFPRSYREARFALRLQDATIPGDRALSFDDLGVYRLLAEVRDLRDIERFARDWLGALIAYDEHRGAELVTTLDRYLESGRSHEAATAVLAVHRSTLKYRLRRIAEISGHDLGDPGVRFNLQLATRVWATLLAVRGPGGAPPA